MEYKRIVQTVVETPTYLAIANKLFSEDERADIWHFLQLIRNVETSSAEPADFERFGLHAKEWEKAVGQGLCISGSTRDSRFF
jgi:hypothetical protein